jgi:hypothetical protein
MPRTLFALLLCLLIALPGASQAQGSIRTDGPRQSAFESLKDSQWVRLASPEVGRREGRLLEHGATELVLSQELQPLRLPATTIDTLWTRGHSTRTGAIVGAVLGAGIGILAGTQLGEQDEDKNARWYGGWGAAGMVAGGLVGVLIGTAVPRWHRQYP